MATSKRSLGRVVLFTALAAGATAGPAAVQASDGGGLVLVVGKGSPISNVSKAELNHVFSAEPIKIAGQNVVPFSLAPASSERQAFDRVVLGMTPDEVQKFWIDRRIRGQGNPPKTAPSPEVVAKVVANFPGAMGYVPAANLNPALKPVTIDGKSYTDPAYLLKQAR